MINIQVNVEEATQNGLKVNIPRMKAHITRVSHWKERVSLGLFGKKPAVVDIEPIAETGDKAQSTLLVLRKLMKRTCQECQWRDDLGRVFSSD